MLWKFIFLQKRQRAEMERPLNIEGHVLWHQSELDFLHEIKPYLHNIRYKVSNNIAIKVIKTRNSRIVLLSDRLLLWGIVEFLIKMVNCTVNCFFSFFFFCRFTFSVDKTHKVEKQISAVMRARDGIKLFAYKR